MNTAASAVSLGWGGIVRLGLVQTALGAVIVLTTSTMNRVMVVEFALPAMLPGVLVALHHVVQMLRPHFGYGSDRGGRRTPWIIGGMAVLALGGIGASVGTAFMETDVRTGTAVSVLAFILIGLGAGASGTSLLTLLAKQVEPGKRAAAATIVWIMMIAGFAVTAGLAGHFLDPFSPQRLIMVTSAVALGAFVLTLVSVFRLELPVPEGEAQAIAAEQAAMPDFRAALRDIWAESAARRFTIFVFVSMFAYSAQDLILEPFAGTVFGMTPGESTKLAGIQHSGVLLGMLAVAITGTVLKRNGADLLRMWTVGGCLASALALAGIAFGGGMPADWPLRSNVFFLGVANGAFAVAAIASMMTLAGEGQARREGLRMGLWGAAQAIAFALGGFLGTVAFDVSRLFMTEPASAYGLVFTGEAIIFVVAAVLGLSIGRQRQNANQAMPSFGAVAMANIMEGKSS